MKNTILLLSSVLLVSLNVSARTEICPENAPSEVIPKISVKVKLDNKTSKYSYDYKVTNDSEAKVPIWRFSIEADSAPLSTGHPAGWLPAVYDKKAREIYWTYDAGIASKNTYIRPGRTLAGFQVVSKTAPGTVKTYVDGDVADIPIVKFENDEAEADPEAITCPGFYNGSGNSDYVVTATKGPAIKGRIEAKIRIKKPDAKLWVGSPDAPPDIQMSPLDYGQIDMVLFGNKAIDVTKIDYGTLKFGPGKAEIVPVKKAIIKEFKDVSDSDIYGYLQKNKAQHLLLGFNIQEIEVRCNVDYTLFLTGKLGGKNLFGAVNIKPVECDKQTFAREAAKDKYKKTKGTTQENEIE